MQMLTDQKALFLHIQSTGFLQQTSHSMTGTVPSPGDTKMHGPCSHGVHSLAGVASINGISNYNFKVLRAVTSDHGLPLGWGQAGRGRREVSEEVPLKK